MIHNIYILSLQMHAYIKTMSNIFIYIYYV